MKLRQKQVFQHLSSTRMQTGEEKTQPLPTLRELAFRAFLARHQLSLLDVAVAAGVRLLTVWNVARDYPVSRQQAEMVRAGLYRLTGVQYRGGIALRQEQACFRVGEAFLREGNG